MDETGCEDERNRLQLADSLYGLGQYSEALEAYKKAIEFGFGLMQYNYYAIAACYARLGEKEQTLAWLEKALFEQRSGAPTRPA